MTIHQLKKFLKENKIQFKIFNNHFNGVMFDTKNLNIVRNKFSYGSENGFFEIQNKNNNEIEILKNNLLKKYIMYWSK